MQGRDDSREGSAFSVPCPEPETLPRGQASVSTPLQSATDSPSLEKAPPTTATPATPASEQGSPSLGLSSGAVPAQGGAGSAEAVVDDVFSTADEVLSAPDSPHKEFHCAVLRALSKEPSVVEAAKADRAPGTPDEAESCLKIWPSASLLPLLSIGPSHHIPLYWECGNPCLLCPLLFLGVWSLLPLFYHAQASSQPTVQSSKPLLDYFSPIPSLSDVLSKGIRVLADQIPVCSLIGRGAE